MIILHGDNIVASRQKLGELLTAAQQKNKQVMRLEAAKLTAAQLEQALTSNSLFGDEQLVVIEELHSLPTSAKKKEFVSSIAGAKGVEIILWEKRTLTKTMLKPFATADAQEFKASKAIFQWTQCIGTSMTAGKKIELLHQAIEQDSDMFCFIMLVRQIRMLIQAKDGGKIAGPPFMQQKLRSQAAQFSLEELLDLHSTCHRLDLQLKTSTLPLELRHHLEQMTVQ